MVAICESPTTKIRRHRHRSYRRKAAESFILVFGTPFLLFAVLALSVEWIEYRPLAPPAPGEVSLFMSALEAEDPPSIGVHRSALGS